MVEGINYSSARVYSYGSTRFSTLARTPRSALLLAWCSSSAVFHDFFFVACLVFELEVFLLNNLYSEKITCLARVMEKKIDFRKDS